jgi:3-methyladenine DNA glycosylase/8-oxoguanine DNA glycosylase
LIKTALGADLELSELYGIARKDSILEHVIDDLYGMHDTFPITFFLEAALAILLQIAPLKRSNEMMASFIQKYGEVVEFEGKNILAWSTPKRISGVQDIELAENCKVGYRAKNIISLARKLAKGDFLSSAQVLEMDPDEAKNSDLFFLVLSVRIESY